MDSKITIEHLHLDHTVELFNLTHANRAHQSEWPNATFVDHAVYSMLASEYADRNSALSNSAQS